MSFSDDDFDDIYGDAPKPVETVPIPEQPQPEVKETAPAPPPPTIEEKENNDKVADVKEVANPIPEIKEDIGPLPEIKENTENAPIKADLSSEIKKMFVGGLNWDTTEIGRAHV